MSPQNDYLVQIPDHPSAHQNRTTHLSAHLNHSKPQIAAGQLVLSGPSLSSYPGEGEGADGVPEPTGSIMVLRAGSEEQVWEMIRGNPYATEGVWDLGRAAITRFRCAVRTAL